MTFTIKSASMALGTDERVTITAVSSTDLFGWARARLSNGRSIFCKYPIIGDVWEIIRHPAEILRVENEDAFIVTRWKMEDVKMTRAELVEKLGLGK